MVRLAADETIKAEMPLVVGTINEGKGPGRRVLRNTFFVTLFIYQQGLVYILNVVNDTQTRYVSALTVAMVGIAFLVNIRALRVTIQQILALVALPIVLITIKYAFYGGDAANVFAIFEKFVTIGLAGVFLGILEFDTKRFLTFMYWIGMANFLVLSFVLLFRPDYLAAVQYMRFSDSMLPSAMLFVVAAIRGRMRVERVANLLLFIVAGSMMLTHGARGSLAVLFVFVVIYTLVEKKILLCVVLSVVFAGLFTSEQVLLQVQTLMDSHGYDSYAVAKLLMQVQEGLWAASSSRGLIYQQALTTISQHPLFGGAFFQLNLSPSDDALMGYQHNIFLEIGATFGIPLLLVFVAYLAVTFLRFIFDANRETTIVFLVLLSLGLGELMFSGTLWTNPAFWLFMSATMSASFVHRRRT